VFCYDDKDLVSSRYKTLAAPSPSSSWLRMKPCLTISAFGWKLALRKAGDAVSVISPRRYPFKDGRETLGGIVIHHFWSWNSQAVLGYVFGIQLSLLAQFALSLSVCARTRFRTLHAL